MNIILEGPEAAGKTTLANVIIEKYPFFNYSYSTLETANDYNYYSNLLKTGFTVCDRFFVGEEIYHKIYNRASRLSAGDNFKLIEEIKNNGDIFVIFYASDIEILKSRLIDHGEEEYIEEIEKQNKWFYSYSWHYFPNFGDYDRYFVVDISKPDTYTKLYADIFNILDKELHGAIV